MSWTERRIRVAGAAGGGLLLVLLGLMTFAENRVPEHRSLGESAASIVSTGLKTRPSVSTTVPPSTTAEPTTTAPPLDPLLQGVGWNITEPPSCVITTVDRGAYGDSRLLSHLVAIRLAISNSLPKALVVVVKFDGGLGGEGPYERDGVIYDSHSSDVVAAWSGLNPFKIAVPAGPGDFTIDTRVAEFGNIGWGECRASVQVLSVSYS